MRLLSKGLMLLLSSLIVLTSVTACKKDAASKTDTNEKPKKDVTLTWYLRGNYTADSPIKSHNEMESLKEIQNKTGIKINFIDVPGSNDEEDQQFKLMIASGDYPDIIHWKPVTYPGSTPKLLKDGVILKLNDLIDKNAPNLKKILDSNPDIKKEIQTDDGTIAFFPNINPLKAPNDFIRQANTGFVIRKDWLDKVGLNIPVTLDDWYTVLKAFKDKDPNGDNSANEIPFDGTGLNMFGPAFGIRTTFYLDPKKDKAAYGLIEPAYKDYLTLLNKWYKEGLLGRYTILNDTKAVDTEINGDIIGSFKGLDNAWTKYLPALKKKNPAASLAAIPWPIGPAGKAYTDRTEMITHINQEQTFVTSKCKYPDEATKLMDFLYTEEGKNILTWGIEGKSYTVENGKKKFIPSLIGAPVGQPSLGQYIAAGAGYPKFDGGDAYLTLSSPDQIVAGSTWSKSEIGLLLPAGLSFTAEESAKLTELTTDISTYSTNMTNKFITGEEPLTNFDTYIQTMKKMGTDDAIKIYQTSYDRYKSRK